MIKRIILIEESLNEFAKRGRPTKKDKNPIKSIKKDEESDDWYKPEDDEEIVPDEEMDVDTSDMEGAEAIEVEEDEFDDELFKALKNEVKLPEFSRGALKFRLKGEMGKIHYGIPMIQMGDDAFLFKLENGIMKKVHLKDVILEQAKNKKRGYFLND